MSKKLTKIQRFAKGQPCQLRIPGVCRTTPDNEDTCLCHAPHPNRGGMRTDDEWGCVGCMPCHDMMDHRVSAKSWYAANDMPEAAWLRGIYEWQAMLKQAGLMKVEGIEPELPKQLPRRIVKK